MKPETFEDRLLMEESANGRTVAIYGYGSGYLVEVDYGKPYTPSRLLFDSFEEAYLRYADAVNGAKGKTDKSEWVHDEMGDWHCSNCKAIVEADEQGRHNWFYCYHCGKKMCNPYYAK